MIYRVGVLKVELRKEVVVHSVKHFDPIHLAVGVVYVHLVRVKKTKFEVERVEFSVDFVRSCVAGEEGVEVVIWAICKSEELLGQMPK